MTFNNYFITAKGKTFIVEFEIQNFTIFTKTAVRSSANPGQAQACNLISSFNKMVISVKEERLLPFTQERSLYTGRAGLYHNLSLPPGDI